LNRARPDGAITSLMFSAASTCGAIHRGEQSGMERAI
jgi:hypothetical protein